MFGGAGEERVEIVGSKRFVKHFCDFLTFPFFADVRPAVIAFTAQLNLVFQCIALFGGGTKIKIHGAATQESLNDSDMDRLAAHAADFRVLL